MTCSKLIQPAGGGPITLTFTQFNTEAGYDFVRVYDGSTTSSPLLGSYSGSSLSPVLTSSGGSMLITFTTDGAVVGDGWSATYITSKTKSTEEMSKQEIPPVKELIAYPNPTSGILTIESSSTKQETYTIDLINPSGQVILNRRIDIIDGKFDIDMSDVSPGPYLLKIITNKTVEIIRVIKN
jgi:hypothetical protein